MASFIKSSRDGAVATVTIDRPAEGNLFNLDMLHDLTATINEVAKTDAKVIVMRGAGDNFCKGRDPKGPPSPTAMAMRTNVTEPILSIYDALGAAPQPVIAVVQGIAHGFGSAMAGAADITIAADDATFAFPEMQKDLPPTLAISAVMARMPRKALTWMVYSMKSIDAATALQLGMVSQVVPKGDLDKALADILVAMTARSPESLVAVKDFFRTAPYMEPRGVRDFAGNLLASVLSSAGK